MAETSNLKLYVTPSSDMTTSLMTWLHSMAASDKQSNMVKIDEAYAEMAARIEEVAEDPGMSFDELQYDDNNYLHILKDGVDVVPPVFIQGGGGGSTSPTGAIMKLLNTTGSTTVPVALGYDCTLKYRFSSVDDTTGESTGPGEAVYALDGTVILTEEVSQGDKSYTVPAASLTEGNHTFTVTVTDNYSTVRILTWKITVKAISLTCQLDDTVIYNVADYATGLTIRYTPIGSDVNKTTSFELNGKIIHTAETTTTNVLQNYILPAQPHGSHRLRMWTTATVGGVKITSKTLEYDLVWVEDGNYTPIISIKSFTPPRQHSTAKIPYMAYDPNNLIASISQSENSVTTANLTVDRSLQTWNYTPNTAGTKHLAITCGEITESTTFTVEESSIDVDEITNNLVWKFDPDGRSNADVNYDTWSYGDVEMTVSDGFKWNRGGWTTDEDGYPCFTVPAGCSVSFSSSMFSTDWKRTGHNIKIVYKATNVSNYDAHVASCMADGKGIEINAQNATLYTQGASTTVQLCEDYYTELEWNVTPTTNYSEIITWVQGIPSQIILYASGDSFVQSTIAPLVFGSDDCDVNIYCIREYSGFLADKEIFANWLIDSPSGEIMLERNARNQILDDNGDLSPDKLAEVHPNLRVLKLSCPSFTEGKNYKVSGCTLTHTMMSDPKKHCWTAYDMSHKGQGTSSDAYGNSARNLDFDFRDNGITLQDGTHLDGYAMTDNSIPVAYMNLKVDVASSEGANNAYLAADYQRFNPYIRPARARDPRVRDTMEFHPAVLFVQDMSGKLFGDTKYHFYSAGNLGNSKKNFEAQGFDESNPRECVIELKDNIHDVQRWKSDDLTEDGAWGDIVDFRYPDAEDATQQMKDSFQRVLSWVVSTDSTRATNEPLGRTVAYGTTVYKVDSAAYRLDKFRYEFDDYFISDSIMFYYLFTERHLMTDNRAKNTFWHTEDGLHWDLTCDYDNDTAMGCDNDGYMTRRYGLEDTDVLGDTDVYNAKDSVLFCNVRDCFQDRLAVMFQQMESKDAWSATRILNEMKAYQSIQPEWLWILNMRRKYIRPYEELNDQLYLPRMNGTKELQRAQFQLYQEDYIASKYASAHSKESRILFRANKQPDAVSESGAVTVTVTMYQDCYLVLDYDGVVRSQRVKRGEPTTMSYTVAKLNDTPVYIYTGHKVQAIGDVSDLRIGSCDLVNASKLQELVISEYRDDYTNTNFKNAALANCSLLKRLIICGCPSWATALDLTSCPRLETVDVRGTNVTVVSFATDGYLQIAQLPGSVTGITAKKLTYFSDLRLAGYDNLQTLHVEYCPALNTMGIVNSSPNLLRVRLIDVGWTMQTADVLTRLSYLAGIDDSGADVSQSVVAGKAHVNTLSPSRYNTLMLAFPDLIITYDTVAPQYTVRFLNDDGSVLDVQIVEHGAAAEDPITRKANPIPVPTKESTPYYKYTYDSWSKAFSSIMQDIDIQAIYTYELRQYTVTWLNGLDIVEQDVVDAGGSAEYNGPVLTRAGQVWKGFDGEAAEVLSDMNISAVFGLCTMPSGVVDPSTYEYVYSDNPDDSSGYTLEEFVGILNSGSASEYFADYAKIKIVNTGNIAPDNEIVLTLHSTKHFFLGDASGKFANSTWFTVGALNVVQKMNTAYSNEGGYAQSELRTWLNDAFFASLPYHWKSVIKKVQVPSNAGNKSTTIAYTYDYLYPPAIAELGYEVDTVPYKDEVAPGADEVQFDIYTSATQRIKRLFNGTGTNVGYWTRSADVTSDMNFHWITSGGYRSALGPAYTYNICFGLSI